MTACGALGDGPAFMAVCSIPHIVNLKKNSSNFVICPENLVCCIKSTINTEMYVLAHKYVSAHTKINKWRGKSKPEFINGRSAFNLSPTSLFIPYIDLQGKKISTALSLNVNLQEIPMG